MYFLQRARQDTSGLGRLTGNSGSVQYPPNETRHPGSPRDLLRLVWADHLRCHVSCSNHQRQNMQLQRSYI
jgi:hypothetical protein